MNDLETNAQRLQKTIKSPAAILNTLQAAASQLAIESEAFTSALAEEAGLEAGSPIALAALKIRNLQKSDQNLQDQIAGLNKSLKKLEDPMSKLSRGVRNGGGSKHISIDLNGIEKGIKSQTGYAGKITASAGNFRSAISSYEPSQQSNDSLTLQNMLLLYLLLDNNDHAYSHSTLGIAPGEARTLDTPGTDPSVPDIHGNFTDSALNTMDTAMPDVPSIDVPNIQLEVPDFSVPEISVPEISVPDISVPDTSPFSGGTDSFTM